MFFIRKNDSKKGFQNVEKQLKSLFIVETCNK